MKFILLLSLVAVNAVQSLHLHKGKAILQLEGRVAGGQSATKGQFPYVVLIETHFDLSYKFCGGSFIAVRWVISAASCFYNMQYARLYLGITEIDDADISYNVIPSQVSPHPLWNHAYSRHDIALVRIPDTNFCLNVFPVPLPHTGGLPIPNFVGSFAFISGWGGTTSSFIMTTLQYARMAIISNPVCGLLHQDITANEICATKNPGTTLGHIDIGGPLVTEDGLLVGVMSNFVQNVDSTSDSVVIFTRVSNYLSWILPAMRNLA